MSSKLNSYILTDNIILKMKSDIEDTKKMSLEIGFNLCTKNTSNELQDERHCIGTSCSLTTWKPGCEKGTQIGVFHTHPVVPKMSIGESSPSITDMIGAYRYGVMCIGGAGDNKVKCIVRKDDIPDPKTIQSIRADAEIYERPLKRHHHITTRKTYERYLTKFRELKYIRDKLQERLFNTTEIP